MMRESSCSKNHPLAAGYPAPEEQKDCITSETKSAYMNVMHKLKRYHVSKLWKLRSGSSISGGRGSVCGWASGCSGVVGMQRHKNRYRGCNWCIFGVWIKWLRWITRRGGIGRLDCQRVFNFIFDCLDTLYFGGFGRFVFQRVFNFIFDCLDTEHRCQYFSGVDAFGINVEDSAYIEACIYWDSSLQSLFSSSESDVREISVSLSFLMEWSTIWILVLLFW